MRRPIMLSCALVLLLASCAEDPPREPTFSEGVVTRLETALRDTHRELGAPGMMAGIWMPGHGSWFGAVGTSDPATNAPMRSDQSLRIGSVTKTFTGTILLRLADEGVVKLDDPVSRWVSDVPRGDVITLRQLANMTAGLPSYTLEPSFQDAYFSDPTRVFTPRELVDFGFDEARAGCTRVPEQCFTPGTAFFYSNTNTVLLAMALESASKRPYAELLRAYVTEPLGLSHTFQPTNGDLPTPFVHGVTSQGTEPGEPRRDPTHWHPSWAFAVGDLVSTVDDLRVWAKALGSGALLSDAMRRERFTKLTVPPNDADRAYAVAVGYQKGWWGHSGELPGYNTVVFYRPDIDAVIVVSSNVDEVELPGAKPVGPAVALANELVAIAADVAPLQVRAEP